VLNAVGVAMKRFKWWHILLISVGVVLLGGLINSGIPFSVFRCATPEEAFKLTNHDYKRIDHVLIQGEAAVLIYYDGESTSTEIIERDANGWIPPAMWIRGTSLYTLPWDPVDIWITHCKFNYDNILITNTFNGHIEVSDSCGSEFAECDYEWGGEYFFTSIKELPKDYKLYIGDQTVALD
jgi:hypothetical protein